VTIVLSEAPQLAVLGFVIKLDFMCDGVFCVETEDNDLGAMAISVFFKSLPAGRQARQINPPIITVPTTIAQKFLLLLKKLSISYLTPSARSGQMHKKNQA
jgi:hypothetical protein